jgi:hypothetical protein
MVKSESQARTHAVLVIGLYDLIGYPTTYLIEPPGHSTIHENWYPKENNEFIVYLISP